MGCAIDHFVSFFFFSTHRKASPTGSLVLSQMYGHTA